MGSSVSTVDAAIPHLDVDPVLLDSMPSFLQSSRVHLIPEEAVGKGDNRTDSQSITSVDSGMLDGASDNRSSIMIGMLYIYIHILLPHNFKSQLAK